MVSNPGRTTILLGAGASKEAGVPLSIELTQRIADEIEMRSRRGPTAFALNMAMGAMVAHRSAMGHKVSEGLDVEDVFSAIQMLAARDSLEVAPFVYSWNPWLTAADGPVVKPLASSWEDKFRLAVKDDPDAPRRLAAVFGEGVQSLVGRQPSHNVFVDLEKQMIEALRRGVTVSQPVDYLRPLLHCQGQPIQIATLNYDQSVELMAAEAGVSLDTGIDAWGGSFEWTWDPDAEVRLLKLHGSTNWFIGPRRVQSEGLETGVTVGDGERLNVNQSDSLCVVFGRSGKLRSEGPFLAMLRELDRFLSETERLVVVGYSFRDDHINMSIRRWFNRSDSASVTIVDPNFPKLNDIWGMAPFVKELVEAVTYRPDFRSALRLRRGNQIIRLGARAGLRRVWSGRAP